MCTLAPMPAHIATRVPSRPPRAQGAFLPCLLLPALPDERVDIFVTFTSSHHEGPSDLSALLLQSLLFSATKQRPLRGAHTSLPVEYLLYFAVCLPIYHRCSHDRGAPALLQLTLERRLLVHIVRSMIDDIYGAQRLVERSVRSAIMLLINSTPTCSFHPCRALLCTRQMPRSPSRLTKQPHRKSGETAPA